MRKMTYRIGATAVALLLAMTAVPGASAVLTAADHEQTCNNAAGAAYTSIQPGDQYFLCVWGSLSWWLPLHFVDLTNHWITDPLGLTPVLAAETALVLHDGYATARPVECGTKCGGGGMIVPYQGGNFGDEHVMFLPSVTVAPNTAADPTITACHTVTDDGVPAVTTVIAGEFCLMGTVSNNLGGWFSAIPPNCLVYSTTVDPYFIGAILQVIYPSALTTGSHIVQAAKMTVNDPAAPASDASCEKLTSSPSGTLTTTGDENFNVVANNLVGLKDIVRYS